MKNLTEKTNILNYVTTIFIKIPSYIHKYIKVLNQNTFQDRNEKIAKIFKCLYEGTLKFFQLLKSTPSTIHISTQKLNCKDNPVVVFVVL